MSKLNNLEPYPTIRRWKPNFRYEKDKMIDYELKGFKSTEKSLTDKEQYRINLASIRGQLANGLGSPTVGSYSLKAGQEYDSDIDFSFLNRPDISLVELHEYIENRTKELESYDKELRADIENSLKIAEQKVKDLQNAELQKAEVKKSE